MVEDSEDLKDSGSQRIWTETPIKRENRFIDAVLSYLMGPRFLVYASCALSIWGDRMWHFAMSVFLIELYGHNLLLTAVFGLVVAGSVLVFGALIGDWIDRKPRNKVAHASLFIQNSSVTACCVVLMLVFSYKTEIEQMWHGWFTVFCYAVVIILADLANLASTALTITIQKDWIVVITGDNRGQLAGMNAAIRRMDQVINIFAPLSVGQVMTWASNVIGCGFILGWNLISLLVEFIFLSRVYQLVPPLAVKSQQNAGEYVIERQVELTNVPGDLPICSAVVEFINKPGIPEAPTEQKSSPEMQRKSVTKLPLCFRKMHRMLCTCRDGWKAYYRQSVFLAGLGLAFLYTTVLGFDCITTGYAYTQGISGSLLSILMALSAFSGLMGTILFTKLRKHYGLAVTGVVSSLLHVSCLMLCVFSVFAPGSPFDLGIFSLLTSKNSSLNHETLQKNQLHIYPFQRNINQPILPDRSSIHWTNNTVLLDSVHGSDHPESYISIILLFSGVILARIGLWSFDLTVTQLLQENIPESERGIVNGVQSSMNYLMDLVHFIMVILAPQPQQFGLLVIISLLFVITGHVMYFIYAKKYKIKETVIQTNSERKPQNPSV
ncbi:solute carrier family 40 member 1-like isoform X1 [Mauremys mutica]|uniref:solute carrier family 40 member 1-like isoform X1 n=2 Tax=Mauremys mutica TaxID=74926 RepID=UPI001D15FA66|nr:solute carrier family 40 member 1-like isoform X1 [Mauremys mutica]XP_044862258.1 solute carrier family 40 member 1-like isoform X1 [Mauremys mutica]XP_044862259.1 solute carrier family 40 member 1-like isoform X1 [Mauremys mutica]